MDWLFPSLKATLFPVKSTGDIAPEPPERGPKSGDSSAASSSAGADNALVGEAEAAEAGALRRPSVARGRLNLRRRSSLSDLDALRGRRVASAHGFRFASTVSGPSGDDDPPPPEADRSKGDDERPSKRVGSLLLADCKHPFNLIPLSGKLEHHGGSIGDMINQKLYGSNRSLVSGTSSIAEVVPLETIQRQRMVCAFELGRSNSTGPRWSGNDDTYEANDAAAAAADETDEPAAEDADGDENYDDERRDSVGTLLSESDMVFARRTPSIKERTERLSLLIRKHQGRRRSVMVNAKVLH